MLRPGAIYFSVVSTLFAAAMAVLWAENPQTKPPKEADLTRTLGGKDRYLTHLSTDKPIYRPGETLYVRGVILHHQTRRPAPKNNSPQAQIRIEGPKGDTVASGISASQDSVLGFQWSIPESQPGGEYKIVATYPWSGHAPAERKFDIRSYRAPRLKSQIKFLREGYGPGDEVVGTLHVERAEGGAPAGAKVTILARVDGEQVFEGRTVVDQAGDCVARFPLPADIRRGEGSLAMIIEDGGVIETASKTIPILLQTVDLTMYPEGGDLVAGLENRVYVEAFTPAQKPADLAGVIVDQQGAVKAKYRSEHEGRGRFSFMPKAGQKYTLKITEPAGIKTVYPLPAVKATGAVLSSVDLISRKGDPVRLRVAAARQGDYVVTLRLREHELARKVIRLKRGEAKQTEIPLKAKVAGVLIATLSNSAGLPLAERLIYRQPDQSIQVKITADQKQYVPGGKAKITLQTSDAAGKPTSAVVGVTVTDDSVLEMIDKREQAPRLPVMVLLENDVKELADAHIYLDPQNEQAPLAVDLLLGVQGWRRFALVKTAEFLAQHGEQARRALALRLASPREQRSAPAAFGGGAPFPDAPADAAIEGAPVRENVPVNESAANKGAPPPPAGAQPPPAPLVAQAPPPPVRDVPGKDEKSNEESARLASDDDAAQDFAKRRGRLRAALKEADAKQDAARLLQAGDLQAEMRSRNDFTIVRVYAHQVRSNRPPGQRVDFTETLFWSAGIRTDEKGQASIEFGLNDSVTSFQVAADAFNAQGALGAGSLQIESIEPFYLEPKLPLEVTMGDLVQAPLGIVNETSATLENATIAVDAKGRHPTRLKLREFTLQPSSRVRKFMTVRVSDFNGRADFTLSAKAGAYADRVTRSMMVKPLGFPYEVGEGGLIKPGDTVMHEITIPEDVVGGSLQSQIKIYPTPLASMTAALERLIREPYGCFEQTSSTIYPLVMAQQYFMSHQGVDPSLIERSASILEKGYQRLIGFECKSGGFEWFGNDPGHDALTAYGLLEFTDMSQVRHVDPQLLERTRKWLLEQRDGKGGYQRKTHTLHTWLPDPEIANTYNTWAMLEAGVDADLSREVGWIADAAFKSQNTYVLALAANVLQLAKDKRAAALLDQLAGKQGEKGALQGATRSVVGSGGEALAIETTSLAVLAWLRDPSFAPQVEKGIQYLAESCKAGRFGSTQSTVLALRAIVAYDQSRAHPKAPGWLQLLVDGKPIGKSVKFTEESRGAIDMPAIEEYLTPGKHKIQIKMEGGSQMPYSVTANYFRRQPDSSDECKLHLQTRLRNETIKEGELTESEVVVVNRSGEKTPNPVAIIGVPGGLEVSHDHLKELVKQSKIAAYEVLGRDVVLYWRVLQPEERVEVAIRLTAAIPGEYSAPASRAYLYYTDEHKHWVAGLKAKIRPR